jgi:diadenosine tetraphosphate (Ap4A) HIT family hydrolase
MADCLFCDALEGLRKADTCPGPGGTVIRKIVDLPASVAVLGPDQFYRGYAIVVARTHATELYHLTDAERAQFLDDMVRVARAIDAAFRPRKMNYECLGNLVGHLHWHLFPRYADDPMPLRPIWNHSHPPAAPSDAEAAAVIAALRKQLG